ncbi:hypothetical protein KY317_03185 [Candidatus Woesearchaeota archaeon]|nr:hypothetical protein [Candidatus Woesearchaeota archaeon]
MAKAVGLLSGGLDSVLAVKVLLDAGVDIHCICFKNIFGSRCSVAVKQAKQMGVPIKLIKLGKKYLDVIRYPKHGVGSGANPCIDCRIFMLRKAKKYADKIKAKFIFTGDVLGQRPMSQKKSALELIDRKLCFEVLRPLSAKLLHKTEIEKKWVNRKKLLNIEGRKRTEQIRLAKGLVYSAPAGGCLLCEKGFAVKLKDLFEHKQKIDLKDIELLKIGRHFRTNSGKIIVGRNEKENDKLLKLKEKADAVIMTKDIPGPVTLLQGSDVKLAARITMRYADASKGNVYVNGKKINVKAIGDKQLEQYRIK